MNTCHAVYSKWNRAVDVAKTDNNMWRKLIIMVMYSVLFFSKLEHIAHYKAKNQNGLKQISHTCTQVGR